MHYARTTPRGIYYRIGYRLKQNWKRDKSGMVCARPGLSLLNFVGMSVTGYSAAIYGAVCFALFIILEIDWSFQIIFYFHERKRDLLEMHYGLLFRTFLFWWQEERFFGNALGSPCKYFVFLENTFTICTHFHNPRATKHLNTYCI